MARYSPCAGGTCSSDRRLLEIRRNYVQRRGRKIEKDTKTHQMRRISLDPDTSTVLEEHRDRALHRARLLDVASIDDWYLFSSDPAHSRPLNPDWITHRYTDMAAEHGISTHLHELRHYSATELLSAGVDLATVSGRLGHGGGGATTHGSTRLGSPLQTNEQPKYLAPKCRNDGHERPTQHERRRTGSMTSTLGGVAPLGPTNDFWR